jgi:glycosyltransferase involved in cell wall biosynthesis
MSYALCYVCDEYPPVVKVFGGIGTALREHAETFARRGRRVDVICRTTDCEPGVRVINGVRIHVVKPSTIPKIRAVVDRVRLNGLVRRICANPGDIVVATEYAGPLLVRAFRNPLVVHIEGAMTVAALSLGNRVRRMARFLERRTVDLADEVCAVSRFSAEVTVSALGARPRQVRVFPNTVDPVRFQPGAGEVVPNSVLFVGKICRLKGAFVLAEAVRPVFTAIPGATLTLIGADLVEDGRSCLEQFLAYLDPGDRQRVRVLGRLGPDDVARELRRCALMVLPSLVDMCPVSVLEAMSCGRPVLASNRGGIPELVQDGCTGMLADPDRPETFTDALLELLTQRDRAEAMGRAGREVVLARFTTDALVDRLERFYEDVSRGPASTQCVESPAS